MTQSEMTYFEFKLQSKLRVSLTHQRQALIDGNLSTCYFKEHFERVGELSEVML